MDEATQAISPYINGRRLSIGVMLNWLEESYQQTIFSGIRAAAEKFDITLVCFDGGTIQSNNEHEARRNYIYNFISPESVDGLIILTGTMVIFCGINGMTKYLQLYKSLPVISLSLQAPETPSILIDNKSGIREAVIHLIKEHNCKRFAFIGGPKNNQDAIERLDTFKKTLAEYNIPFREDFYYEGQFTNDSGRDAIKYFITNKNGDMDAVLAANDNMALGALEGLRSLGKSVPKDFKLVGFDNIDDGQFSFPSLTTISQPLYDMGKRATEQIIAAIHGKKLDMTEILPTKLIIRESCGCFSQPLVQIESAPGQKLKSIQDIDTKKITQDIIAHIRHEYPDFETIITQEGILSLLKTFMDSIGDEKCNDFIFEWNMSIGKNFLERSNTQFFQSLLNELYTILIPMFSTDNAYSHRAEFLFQQARMIVSEKEVIFEKYHQHKSQEDMLPMDYLREALLVMFDDAKVRLALNTFLPRLGIRKFFVSKFLTHSDEQLKNSRLMMTDDQETLPEELRVVFPSNKLIPEGIRSVKDRMIWIVEAISHYNPIGFFVMEMGSKNYKIYSEIRRIISSTTQGSLLFNQVTEQTHNLQKQSEILQKNVEYLRKIMGAIIQTLAMTVEAKDPYTAGHERRVADLARTIAFEMGLSRDDVEAIRLSAVVHDLGKLYVPSEILTKPGKLRDAEFALIKLHPEIAYDILKMIEFPWPLAEIVYQHHERLDGTGYPRGLKGDEIRMEARIIAVADVVEAMASHRPYRPTLGLDAALNEIRSKRGTAFDPAVVDICLDLFERGFMMKMSKDM